MPRFLPFAGLRYGADLDPAAVTAPPYDVINEAQRGALVERSDHNAVIIDLPRAAGGEDPYTAAGETVGAWKGDGTLVSDDGPTFTIYRMGYHDDRGRPAQTLGVIGALELAAPGEGGILPHEHTTPKDKSDRLNLLRGTRANLSAVWGLSLSPGLGDLLDTSGEADCDFVDEDGVRHTAWVVTDPDRIARIAALVADTPVVVADGHHRYETSLAYRDERRAEGGTAPTDPAEAPAEATMTYVVELAPDQLTVLPIHRLLTGVPTGTDLIGPLAAAGLEPANTVAADEVASGRVLAMMDEVGALALVAADGSAQLLVPDPGTFAEVAALDSARLASAVEGSEALSGTEITFEHSVDAVVAAVAAGEADAGVLLRPANVNQIEANAHAGERMPPKTTFFYPKPRTGIVFRPLD